MTELIELSAIPNQSFTIVLDDIRYGITLKATKYFMICDVSIDGAVVVTGQRVLQDCPLIPFQYLEGDGGNFGFISDTETDPWYEFFGDTQFLVYFSRAELEVARGI